jgi:hypothetical protein
MRDASMHLLEALERLESLDRRFQLRSRSNRSNGTVWWHTHDCSRDRGCRSGPADFQREPRPQPEPAIAHVRTENGWLTQLRLGITTG